MKNTSSLVVSQTLLSFVIRNWNPSKHIWTTAIVLFSFIWIFNLREHLMCFCFEENGRPFQTWKQLRRWRDGAPWWRKWFWETTTRHKNPRKEENSSAISSTSSQDIRGPQRAENRTNPSQHVCPMGGTLETLCSVLFSIVPSIKISSPSCLPVSNQFTHLRPCSLSLPVPPCCPMNSESRDLIPQTVSLSPFRNRVWTLTCLDNRLVPGPSTFWGLSFFNRWGENDRKITLWRVGYVFLFHRDKNSPSFLHFLPEDYAKQPAQLEDLIINHFRDLFSRNFSFLNNKGMLSKDVGEKVKK